VLHAAAFRSANGTRTGTTIRGDGCRSRIRPAAGAFAARRTLVFGDHELAEFGDVVDPLRQEGIRTLCCAPLVVRDLALGTLEVGSLQTDAFTPAAVVVIDEVARQVAMAVANAVAFREIGQLKDKLAGERLYLESEIRAEHPFEEVVGRSRPLQLRSSRSRSWRRPARRSSSSARRATGRS